MKNRINELLAEIEGFSATNLEQIEQLRIKYLSKKGEISLLFNDFRNVPNEEKKEIGQLLNQLKDAAQNKLNALKDLLGNEIGRAHV